jgi:hypothetical protein
MFIVVARQADQPACATLSRAIRQIASTAGYAEIAVPPADHGRARVLAIFGRGDQRIILYDWDRSCVVHADEREYVLHTLRSYGYDAHVEVRTYPSMIELIPYAP